MLAILEGVSYISVFVILSVMNILPIVLSVLKDKMTQQD